MEEKRFETGPASAAIVSAGVGAFVLGLMTTGAAVIPGLNEALNLTNPVGPLSGKTAVAVVIWVISWVVLHFIWKDRDFNINTAFTIVLVLTGLGIILTFPLVFEAFAAE
jgi:hypothetical protein